MTREPHGIAWRIALYFGLVAPERDQRTGAGVGGALRQPLSNWERRYVRFLPIFIVLGVAFFLIGMVRGSTSQRLVALVWVVAVPLWVARYMVYRRERLAGGARADRLDR